MTYKDTITATVFYVESDGRHLANMAPDGRLLWVRDPFADLALCPYRNLRPIISEVGPADPANLAALARVDAVVASFWKWHPHLILIEYNSSQRIFVDAKTGDSIFGGNN